MVSPAVFTRISLFHRITLVDKDGEIFVEKSSGSMKVTAGDWEEAEWYLDVYEQTTLKAEPVFYLFRAFVYYHKGTVEEAEAILELSDIAEYDSLF